MIDLLSRPELEAGNAVAPIAAMQEAIKALEATL